MQKSSSDAVIRQVAMQQFDELGYTILDGAEEEQGFCAVTGRQNTGEVVLVPTLRKSLHDLNPDCADELIEKARQPIAPCCQVWRRPMNRYISY